MCSSDLILTPLASLQNRSDHACAVWSGLFVFEQDPGGTMASRSKLENAALPAE